MVAKLLNIIVEEPHILIRRAFKQDCVVCKKEGISRQEKKRRILGEISTNLQSNSETKGCRKGTNFGCNICNTPLL